MPIKELNHLSSQEVQSFPWKKAVPAASRIDFFTGQALIYRPKEKSKQEPFFKRLISWISPLKKPLGFAQKACEIAEKVPGIKGAEALSEAFSDIAGVFSITACIEAVAAVEKRLNNRGLEDPMKLAKLMLSLLKGVTKSIKWMDQVGVVDLTKESEENIKAAGLFEGVSSSLITLLGKIAPQSSYKQILQSSYKALVAILKLCGYLFYSQLIKTILKPLTMGGALMNGGFALNDHYNKYSEGKDSWQMAMLRLGDTGSSLGLSLLALGAWYAEVTVVLPTLVVALSLLQLGCEISLYLS